MRVQAIEAQVWWIAVADEVRAAHGLPWNVWFEALQKAFKFAQAPTSLPQPGAGFDFKEGSLETADGLIAVAGLSVYQDGISVHVRSNTRNAEKALQASLDVFASLGVREPITPPLHYYVSQIVVDFDKSLDSFLPASLLESITAAMPIEGDVAHFSGFQTNFDPMIIRGRAGPINPSMFRIERRVGVPYAQNRYFCVANTTTEKHLEILEEIERSLAAT